MDLFTNSLPTRRPSIAETRQLSPEGTGSHSWKWESNIKELNPYSSMLSRGKSWRLHNTMYFCLMGWINSLTLLLSTADLSDQSRKQTFRQRRTRDGCSFDNCGLLFTVPLPMLIGRGKLSRTILWLVPVAHVAVSSRLIGCISQYFSRKRRSTGSRPRESLS